MALMMGSIYDAFRLANVPEAASAAAAEEIVAVYHERIKRLETTVRVLAVMVSLGFGVVFMALITLMSSL